MPKVKVVIVTALAFCI